MTLQADSTPSGLQVQLDYALAPQRGRKYLRQLTRYAIFAFIAFAAWRWIPLVCQHAQILWWQHQCLTYTAPPEMVVYEEDSAAAAELIKKAGYSSQVINRSAESFWRELEKENRQHFDRSGSIPIPTVTAASFCPSCLNRFYIAWHPRWRPFAKPTDSVIFLHELISPAGHRQVVAFRYSPSNGPFFGDHRLDFPAWDDDVWIAATLFVGPTPATLARCGNAGGGLLTQSPRTRIYAGQVDPADLSHFTVRYEMWGQADILDGRLRDDGRVILTPRKKPI